MKKTQIALVLAAACFLSFMPVTDVAAQNQPNPNMAMTLFPIVKQGSQQFLITPKGFHVAIPGKGIASNAKEVAVYQDPAQNYWYINKHGEPTAVSPQVVQSAMAQIQAQANAAQNAGYGGGQPYQQQPYGQYQQAPVQQTTIIQQPQDNGGSGNAALGMVGSAAGAFAGAALGNSLYQNPTVYGVPYGRPVYRGDGNNGNNYYYHNNSGDKTYIDNAHVNNVNTSQVYSQFNKQGEWNNRDQWSKNLQGGGAYAAGATTTHAAAAGGEVNAAGASAGRFGAAGAEGGRFGAASAEGGRFGAAGAGGGRFGAAGAGGGRFGGAGGGRFGGGGHRR